MELLYRKGEVFNGGRKSWSKGEVSKGGRISQKEANFRVGGGQKWKLLLTPTSCVYINKQNGGRTRASLWSTIFHAYVKIRNVKENKNIQQATEYAANTI
jgi:hypothetical protein